MATRNCACAHYKDGSVYRSLCSVHASNDPCATISGVTGKRRKGSVRGGICTNCGWNDLDWVFPDECRSRTGEYPEDGNFEHVGAVYDPHHRGFVSAKLGTLA